ncbi:MAG TPA: LysR family transcriptional regulator [Burkholderiales bacterium]|nr:LysR family transcriptional regulator [Burkholderiales bacterium]
MDPELRHLRAFAAVAVHGGFTRAAERLRSTQPALTLLVRQLEESLGARLFDRNTRNVQLTATGAQLLPAVERLLADLETTIGGVRDAVARASGRVVVATLPSIASSMLPQAIARAVASNPGIAVAVRDAVAGRISAMVRTGEADLGVAGRPDGEEGLAFEKLLADRLVAACPQAHALAKRRRVSWGDLVGESFISMSRDSSVRRLVEQAFAQIGQRHEPAYEVVYLSSAVSMAAAGLGIAVVPSSALSALNLERIAVRPLVAPAVEREIGLLTDRNRSLSPAARFFAGQLKDAGPTS